MIILWLRGLMRPEPPVNNIAWHQQAGGFALPTTQQTQKGTIYTLLLRLLCSSISKVLACFGKSMYKTRCLRFSISGVLGIHLLPLDPLRRTAPPWTTPTFVLQWPPPINNPRTGLAYMACQMRKLLIRLDSIYSSNKKIQKLCHL